MINRDSTQNPSTSAIDWLQHLRWRLVYIAAVKPHRFLLAITAFALSLQATDVQTLTVKSLSVENTAVIVIADLQGKPTQGSLLIQRLWFAPSAWESWRKLIEALVAAGLFFVFDSQRREYEIEVTDESISIRGGLLLAAHKVRRGRIHFVREFRGSIFREPALRLSEHGPIHGFLFGFVWVPQNMPQYEEIKSKAMSWMNIG